MLRAEDPYAHVNPHEMPQQHLHAVSLGHAEQRLAFQALIVGIVSGTM